jgi:hypothetical protein
LEQGHGGILLICPSCRRVGAVLARGTSGAPRPVTHFLTGLRPSASIIDPNDPVAGMLAIWKLAVSRCEYVHDGPEDKPGTDVWQTPPETLRRRSGDCEDSALLVTDLFLSAGFRTRMAMGRADGGGHAWSVVHADGNDFIIESTNRHPDGENLPVVQRDSPYAPEILFDRDAIYVRSSPGAPFDGDYWSPQKWLRIPVVRPNATAAGRQSPASGVTAPQ